MTANWLPQTRNWSKLDIHLFIEQANEIPAFNQKSRFFGEPTNHRCKQGQTNEAKMNPAYMAFFNEARKAK